MLDCYCDALIKIGQAKTNCLNGSGRFCYLTNTELYLGKISFSDQLAVNTSEIGSRRAYESFSSAPMKTEISGSWRGNASPLLIGDANALLLSYMLQSNGESTDYAYLKSELGGPADDGGIMVKSLNSERTLPLNSLISMEVSNVIGSYFNNGSTVSFRNLPGGADSDYIRYRSMIGGSVLDSAGTLEVNKVLTVAALYAEDHWYWEKDEVAVMGGAEYPGRTQNQSIR